MNDDVPEPNKQCVLTDDQLLWFKAFVTINYQTSFRAIMINIPLSS
jgi:hypothetical protein